MYPNSDAISVMLTWLLTEESNFACHPETVKLGSMKPGNESRNFWRRHDIPVVAWPPPKFGSLVSRCRCRWPAHLPQLVSEWWDSFFGVYRV